MTIDHDDMLLDALGRGEPAPDGDDIAGLLGAWRSEVDEALPPLRLSTPTTVPARNLGSRWRMSRPALIGMITAVLAFGGLTAASASAEPGSPLWPITQFMFSDKASSKVAEQDAAALLAQARQALADKHPAQAHELVAAARAKIALITDLAVRERLLADADAILAAAPDPANSVLPTPAPLPSNVEPPVTVPGAGSPTPSPTGGGLLPPILPSLLPSLPLPLLG